MSEFNAKVLGCSQVENEYEIILDQTAFYPEGGGQDGDQGYLDNIEVTDTYYKDNLIIHKTNNPINEGSIVNGAINWPLRYSRMQQHAGEHIVSGIINKLLGYDNVGFHMNDSLVTMDYNGPINSTELKKIEIECNHAIYKNLPIKVEYFTNQEATHISYRSKKAIEQDIRIVSIDGVDKCACCGTHTRLTGEIGIIHFTDISNYKGGVRISCVIGIQAVKDYILKEKILAKANTSLSSTTIELNNNIDILLQKQKKLESELIASNRHICDLSLTFAKKYKNINFINIDGLDIKTLIYLCNQMKAKYSGTSLCTSRINGLIYFSLTGNNLKEKANKLRSLRIIRGGGSDTFIQGTILTTTKDILDNL